MVRLDSGSDFRGGLCRRLASPECRLLIGADSAHPCRVRRVRLISGVGSCLSVDAWGDLGESGHDQSSPLLD